MVSPRPLIVAPDHRVERSHAAGHAHAPVAHHDAFGTQALALLAETLDPSGNAMRPSERSTRCHGSFGSVFVAQHARRQPRPSGQARRDAPLRHSRRPVRAGSARTAARIVRSAADSVGPLRISIAACPERIPGRHAELRTDPQPSGHQRLPRHACRSPYVVCVELSLDNGRRHQAIFLSELEDDDARCLPAREHGGRADHRHRLPARARASTGKAASATSPSATSTACPTCSCARTVRTTA